MPRRTDIETILLIGSGPIVIGQACEFDYAGALALRWSGVDDAGAALPAGVYWIRASARDGGAERVRALPVVWLR